MINVEQTIISQYGTSATITQLIQNMNAYLDPGTDFDNFYDFVWNVETAQGFGLDIWGRIVNVSRELTIPTTTYFGFEEALPGSYPFNQAPFYNNTDGTTQTYILADPAYRTLILTKALSNISSSDSSSINQLLTNLFSGRGRCYVIDLGGMALQYTFEFVLNDFEFAIMTESKAIPRPAGVKAYLLMVETPTFGFEEALPGSYPFDQAPFFGGTYYAIS